MKERTERRKEGNEKEEKSKEESGMDVKKMERVEDKKEGNEKEEEKGRKGGNKEKVGRTIRKWSGMKETNGRKKGWKCGKKEKMEGRKKKMVRNKGKKWDGY